MVRRALFLLVPLALAACGPGARQSEGLPALTLSSSAFGDGEPIPVQFSCDGDNISPPLAWDNAPAGTKSFVMIMDDPDAPSGNFRHWGAYNIDAGARYLLAGAGLPGSGSFSQVLNGRSERAYAGPCPPPGDGTHHYRFKLIALGKPQLDMEDDATVGSLEKEASYSRLGQATLVGTFARK